MLLWKHFIDMLNTNNQFISNKGDYPWLCGPHPINLKALRAKLRFPEEEKTLFVNNVSAPIQEFLAHLPVLYISDLHNQMPQMHKSQFLEMSVCMCQFSHSVMSDSLRPHGLQHSRPPCPSPTPGIYPNSCWLCQWCHPTISSSVIPFCSHLQSFPASGSFQMCMHTHTHPRYIVCSVT